MSKKRTNPLAAAPSKLTARRVATMLAGTLHGNSYAGRMAKLSDPDKADALAAMRFPQQQAVALDPSPFISVLCPRRSGKSFMGYTLAVERCFRFSEQIWYIHCTTGPHVTRNYWEPLKRLNETENLNLVFNGTERSITFPNGSKIYLTGGSTMGEIDKIRGQEANGIIIDEAKSYGPDLFRVLVEEIISPALSSRGGQLYVIGTPGNVLAGPFYEATCTPSSSFEGSDGKLRWNNVRYNENDRDWKDGYFVWSFHTWTGADNTSKPGKLAWSKALSDKVRRGWPDDHPTWRRENLAQWVKETSVLVYPVKPYHLVKGKTLGWREQDDPSKCFYVAGADFGFVDGFAYVIWGWSAYEDALYEITSIKIKGATVSEIASTMRLLESELPAPVHIRVGDWAGGGLTLMETLSREHQLPIKAANKAGKVAHIRAFASALEEKKIFLRENSPLYLELEGNRWDEKTIGTPRLREDKRTPNDLCDAALYAFLEADYAFPEVRPTPKPQVTEAYLRKQAYFDRKRQKAEADNELFWNYEDRWDE